MPTSVHDVVSPFAFDAMQVFGYLVFAAAITVLVLASMRATVELREVLLKFRAERRQQSFKFVPPAAKVLTFEAPRKTRNRVVVR